MHGEAACLENAVVRIPTTSLAICWHPLPGILESGITPALAVRTHSFRRRQRIRLWGPATLFCWFFHIITVTRYDNYCISRWSSAFGRQGPTQSRNRANQMPRRTVSTVRILSPRPITNFPVKVARRLQMTRPSAVAVIESMRSWLCHPGSTIRVPLRQHLRPEI